jgi:hypothetical protein
MGMEVGQDLAFAVIGRQVLELEVLRAHVARLQQHECAPIPCQRECCRETDSGGSDAVGPPENSG